MQQAAILVALGRAAAGGHEQRALAMLSFGHCSLLQCSSEGTSPCLPLLTLGPDIGVPVYRCGRDGGGLGSPLLLLPCLGGSKARHQAVEAQDGGDGAPAFFSFYLLSLLTSSSPVPPLPSLSLCRPCS